MTLLHKRKWLIGFGLFAIIMLMIAGSIQPKHTSANNTSEPTEKLTDDKVAFLTEKFMNTILQDINEDYKVINFTSKEDLLNAFDSITTREVAQPYVDYYFYEKENGLFILPTESPEWFNSSTDYDMIQKGNKAIITQYNESPLHGDYTIEIEFTYQKEDWFITNVDLV